MTYKELGIQESYYGKNICITDIDGGIHVGVLIDHTSAYDNDPEPESITIETKYSGLVEIYIKEMVLVELIG